MRSAQVDLWKKKRDCLRNQKRRRAGMVLQIAATKTQEERKA